MLLKMLKSKIHRATVTDKNLNYSGGIRVDPDLLDKVGLLPYECALVVNVNNGTRHETYIQVGARGSGEVCLNGAASRLGEVGDIVIIMSFASATPEEARTMEPKIALVDADNRFTGYLGKA
jgi:aspartate 1-decarboxylase